jgi:aminopeptidase-like protein
VTRLQDTGLDVSGLLRDLYPVCRSITGDGVRETLRRIGEELPLAVNEIASGTPVLDWTVPREWNIRDAYVKDASGHRVIDFRASNLHVVNYSAPVHARMSLDELRPHLHTLPDHPDWIPYRTTYYQETWGFCLRHRDYERLADGEYEVVIDATLEDGRLTWGELRLEGEREDEILLTTHVCHPSMANDNLSGIAVLTGLGRALAQRDRRWSYRLLFLPGTIGSIAWLARNRERVGRVRGAITLAGVGDRGPASWKPTRGGDSMIDRAVKTALAGRDHRLLEYSPYGYDERQFSSPGFALDAGRFSRSEYGQYPEYHTSADDLDFISEVALDDSFACLLAALDKLEGDRYFVNTEPFAEPQLGRRGLYDLPLEGDELQRVRMALLWVLNLSDGSWSLEDIADRAQIPLDAIVTAADALRAAGLLRPV